jgi:hypothetical protein
MAAIGLLGLLAAVGMGLAANEISGDSIGLSAEPLRAGQELAPRAASDDNARDERQDRREDRRKRRLGDDHPSGDDAQSTGTTTTPAAPAVAPGDDNGGLVEPGDDNGGLVEPADDNSGSGSDSSGSGSSGSSDDSSGSGSSGSSGSDDSGGDD